MNFFGIGPMELVFILILALIIFGPGRLPEIGRAVGKSLRDFRAMTQEVTSQFSLDLEEATKAKEPQGAQAPAQEPAKAPRPIEPPPEGAAPAQPAAPETAEAATQEGAAEGPVEAEKPTPTPPEGEASV